MNQLKLHLGCNNRPIHGFVNIDIRLESDADVIADCFKLDNFQSNSVDVIFCSHILEHAQPSEIQNILKRWLEILKPNGEVFISVPDMGKVCEHYVCFRDLNILKRLIWGAGEHPYDFHYLGWDENKLTQDLLAAGFRFPKRYDWRQTAWHFVDTHEQAYLPHMDKKNGILMSLNMKAIK